MRRRFLAAVLLAASLDAQQTAAPATGVRAEIVAGKQGLCLPAGEFTVPELIDAVAAYLCRNYVYDLGSVSRAATFTLQRPLALDALGSEEVLYALLAARDLAVLPVDELRGVHRIVPLDSLRAGGRAVAVTPWRTVDEILRRPRLRELATTAVELQNADAEPLAAALRAHFVDGPAPHRPPPDAWPVGSLMAHAAGPRTLLLHGYRDDLAPAILLVRQIDRIAGRDPSREGAVLQRLQALESEVAALRRRFADRAEAPAGAR